MAISQRLTLEEFFALPEKKPALEYEDGRVTQKVSPQGKHSKLQFRVAEVFNRFGEPTKVAFAFPELRTTFAGYSRVPDVAIYRWERIPLDESGQVANDFREPPDIAVEIASPGQRINALVQRCQWYIEHGVAAVLLLNPLDQSILLFRPDRAPVKLHGPDEIDVSDILPGFQVTVQELFAALTIR